MVRRVEEWASINTYTLNNHGLESFFRNFRKEAGHLNATIRDLPMQGSTQPCLQVMKREEKKPSLLFLGHADTVFSPESPFQSVEVTDQEMIKGPGVADMKGGLAVMLTAIEAFERSPFAKRIGWEILINPDEEVGSPASTPLIMERAKEHRIGLVFEPSLPDGSFISRRSGSLNFCLKSTGSASHAGRAFFEGENAILPLAKVLEKIAEITDEEAGITSNVAVVHGGEALNIVPGGAVAKVNIRFEKSEQLEPIEKKVASLLPPSITYERLSCRLPKPFDEKTKKLFDGFKRCADQLAIPFSFKASRGVCDGNTLHAAGLPAIDTLGAMGGGIHTEEEYLLIPSLVERASLVCLFLMQFANGEFHDL